MPSTPPSKPTRAGAAGAGFAVVATEVKTLAQQTAAATEDITARIVAIQDDADAAVAALGQIASVIDHIDGIQTAISAAVQQQTATTNDMAHTITGVASESTGIAHAAQAVADNASHTTASAALTEQAAHELAGTANQLRGIIAGFQTG